MTSNPDWTAPDAGHDWVDEDILRATGWLRSFVPEAQMERRLDASRAYLMRARENWLAGGNAPSHDRSDVAAWHLLQAETFASGRRYWRPDDAVRVAPYLRRIGLELDRLRAVPGADERAARIMTDERRQPEAAIYELLVALAWSRHGWDVEFVPENRAYSTPDLRVSKPRRRWSVECKRLMPARYTTLEKARGMALAEPVHRLSERLGRALVMQVRYKVELADVPDAYLEEKLLEADAGSHQGYEWSDALADVRLLSPTWALLRKVMAKDDVAYGSSRMIELFCGHYEHQADHSFSGRWRPSATHPFFAHTLYHGSVVSWTSNAFAASRQKARHFRQVVHNAERQLDVDRPGVVHVGVETFGSHMIDAFRHLQNDVEARVYTPDNPRLRWVYGNYFSPEVSTDPNETWALDETMAPYRIGRHRTPWPLPGHLLVSPDDENHPGVHWSRRL
jgi:hypothetical protein